MPCRESVSGSVGYIIAKEMGGDAPLFAAISTGQTAAAFLTLPLVIIAARYFAG